MFKGNQRPYTKECVLIIDKVTGEITLERLSQNVQVKKTRHEGKSTPSSSSGGNNGGYSSSNGGGPNGSAATGNGGSNGASSMSAGALPPQQQKKLENSTQRTVSKTRVSTGQRKGNMGGIMQRLSPLQGSPLQTYHKSPQQAPA